MNAQQFLAEFGHIANAPGGVARLRQMIYQLAVTGSLTQRGSMQEDVSTLLDAIRAERERLVSKNKYKRMLKLEAEPIQPPHGFVLPSTWKWSRLLDIGEINPRNEAADDQLAAFVPMSGIPLLHKGSVVAQQRRWGEIKKGYTHFANDDVVLAKITPCFENGKAAVITSLPADSGIGAGTTELQVFRPIHAGILPGYVYLFLRSPLFTVQGEKSMTGTAGQKRIPTDYFATRAVPLPPTEEQHRIVAKVDELMTFCDRLEKQQQYRRDLQNTLRQSVLLAIANAQSPYELQESWRRLDINFEYLFSEPKDVEAVIAELKNLAVRGLLTNISTTRPDLIRIKLDCDELRRQYIDAGITRRQKLVDIAKNEAAYPEHWGIVPFDEVAIVIGGVTKGRNLRDRKTISCQYLAVANVQRGYFKLGDLKSIEISADELPKYVVKEGDLLITEGGDWDKVGRTSIWSGDIANCVHQNHVFKARIPSSLLKNEWAELVFNSGVGRDYFARASKQTTNLASINMTQLRSFPLPIPPLDEQERILSALYTLTAKCVEWLSQLKRKQDLSVLLANSTVAAFTGIAIDQEKDLAVKVPQTELIAPLRLGTTPDTNAQAPLAALLARDNGEMSALALWQRFGGEIDAFYAQLKVEVAYGWIDDPSYVLDENAPESPKKYPNGAQVAKMKIKEGV
ncbi:type I restriction enzyme, S subunit [Pseudomonas asturiensis]|uniref:Type I restriction enzyme, S subunit n=1 Tax=Pseudomonas asturiensis TaxID=1190415 RepID=A0A1M7Q201_9PSED|nr:restriction endonuclease subunit S [Pseudomonas asturiensis]SHN24173.1 type I restriction enzyme, S subunit [Pseudomonas asturiensis]